MWMNTLCRPSGYRRRNQTQCSRCKHRWPPSSSSCKNARQVLLKCVHRRMQRSPRPRSTSMPTAASHALQSDNQDLREAQLAHKIKIDEGELSPSPQYNRGSRIASPTG